MRIIKPTIIDLPKIEVPRGNLSFIEEENHLPFKIVDRCPGAPGDLVAKSIYAEDLLDWKLKY
jgi:hypothetical protein